MSTNRRKSDVNIWEKRISLYLITAMVALCTMYLSNMNKAMAVLEKEISYNNEKDKHQDECIVTIEEKQLEMTRVQAQQGFALELHDIRLNKVEKKVFPE